MLRAIACAAAALTAAPALAQDGATARFVGADGNEIGSAELTPTLQGTLIGVEVAGLPPGQWVGFHIHEGGECDAEGGFESAGDHFNPSDVEHGYLTETGPHAGDMPNQWVSEDGALRAQIFNPLVFLEDVAGVRGRTLMVHAMADDYQSQPSGHTGDRLACAVIE